MTEPKITLTRDQLEKLLGNEPYLKVSYQTLTIPELTKSDVLLISFLMEENNNLINRKIIHKNSWFYYSRSRCEKLLGIPKGTQSTSLERMAKIGLLELKPNGPNNHTVCKLNWSKL